MGFRAVLFDLGGTLARYRLRPHEIVMEVLRSHGIEVDPGSVREAVRDADEAYAPLSAKIRRRHKVEFRYAALPREFWVEYNRYLLRTLGVEPRPELIDDIIDAFYDTRYVEVYPDAFPVLEALRGLGLRLAIVTNASSFAHKVLRDTGLRKYFDAVAVSSDVGYEKPHPEIFRRALRELGVEPGEAAHVGDSYEADVEGARNAGVVPVLLDRDGTYGEVDCIKISTLYELSGVLGLPPLGGPTRTG